MPIIRDTEGGWALRCVNPHDPAATMVQSTGSPQGLLHLTPGTALPLAVVSRCTVCGYVELYADIKG